MAQYEPVELTLDDTPAALLATIDRLYREQQAENQQRRAANQRITRRSRRARRLEQTATLLVVAGVALVLVGWVLFPAWSVLVGVGGISAGVVLKRRVARWPRERYQSDLAFPARFPITRHVLATLRDDVAPNKRVAGRLDLTGPREPKKRHRERRNTSNYLVHVYRDDWLTLKLKLVDGNVLRVVARETVKVRVGYYKRSRSGKRKWKPDRSRHQQQLELKLDVNPCVYHWPPVLALPTDEPHRIGGYTVEQLGIAPADRFRTDAGTSTRLHLVARAQPGKYEPAAADILGVLRFAYSQLQRTNGRIRTMQTELIAQTEGMKE